MVEDQSLPTALSFSSLAFYTHAAQRKSMLSAMYYPSWPLELFIDMAMILQGLVLFLLLLFQLNWLREGRVEAGMM